MNSSPAGLGLQVRAVGGKLRLPAECRSRRGPVPQEAFVAARVSAAPESTLVVALENTIAVPSRPMTGRMLRMYGREVREGATRVGTAT